MELILRGELGKPVRGVLELQLEIGRFYDAKRCCNGSLCDLQSKVADRPLADLGGRAPCDCLRLAADVRVRPAE